MPYNKDWIDVHNERRHYVVVLRDAIALLTDQHLGVEHHEGHRQQYAKAAEEQVKQITPSIDYHDDHIACEAHDEAEKQTLLRYDISRGKQCVQRHAQESARCYYEHRQHILRRSVKVNGQRENVPLAHGLKK